MPVKKSSLLAGQRSIHSFFVPNKNVEKKTVGVVDSRSLRRFEFETCLFSIVQHYLFDRGYVGIL